MSELLLREVKNFKAKRYFDSFLRAEVVIEDDFTPPVMKPYPNEHSARLQEPDKFDDKTFKRKKDGEIYGSIKVPETAAVIWGKLKEHNKPTDNPIPQAIRFPTDNWTAAEAKAWLKKNSVKYIKFEEASKSKTFECHARIMPDKTKDTNDWLFIEGWASTANIDRYNEVVKPEAFSEMIKHYLQNPILLFMHSPAWPIGKVTELKIDPVEGLWIKAFLSKASWVKDIAILIKEEILKAFSIGFREISEGENIDDVHHYTSIELYEISIVSIGANRESLFSVAKAFEWGSDLVIPTNAMSLVEQGDENEGQSLHKPEAADKAAEYIRKFDAALAEIIGDLKTEQDASALKTMNEELKGYQGVIQK